jgi:hypothetical protein
MSSNDCDIALEKLKALSVWSSEKLTESDTRAKILDPIFKDVLGWSEGDILREQNVHPGFLDYVFSVDGVRWFILEAKKNGEYFDIPESFSGMRYKLDGVIHDIQPLKRAIEQTQSYCIKCGVRYGIVSNGEQFVLFEAFKFNQDWTHGSCIVFRSFDQIMKNFGLFWSILNKQSVKSNGSLRKYISQENLRLGYLIIPIDIVHGKESVKGRNNLSPYLQPFADYFFDVLTKDNQLEVLKECYVRNRPYQRAEKEINHYFDKPPTFAKKYNVQTVIEDSNYSSSFEQIYLKCDSFLRTNAADGSLVVLMGGVGAGKTTFIHHFFKFVNKNKEKTLWFYIDFFGAPRNPDNIEQHILDKIIEQFERDYYPILKDELKVLGIETVAKDEKSIKILFSILKLKQFVISIVLDNADQVQYVEPNYHQHVLLLAKKFTDTFKSITIIALREETFFKSSQTGVLDSFPVTSFHIATPSFEDVLDYRIRYILQLLKSEEQSPISFLDFRVKELLKTFFEIIQNSFCSKHYKGREILLFMDDITGGDMRLALRFFNIFLVSGNTNVDEMFLKDNLELEKGRFGYKIPIHHVIKSIALEFSRLYSSPPSRIMNLFSLVNNEESSHFTKLRVLNYLFNRMGNDHPEGKGFVGIVEIHEEASKASISEIEISNALKKMGEYALVQFENQSKAGFENASYVRISNTGIYYLEKLSKQFQYLSLVWMDTQISDKQVVESLLERLVELKDMKDADDLFACFERTEIFLNYLKKSEEQEFTTFPELRQSDLTSREFVKEIISAYEESKKRIEESRMRYASEYMEKF